MQTLATYSSDIDVHLIGPGTFAGACRYLQASSRTELFWEYVAFSRAKSEEPASYSTFLRVAKCILKPGLRSGHLKFRGVNQHGQCNQCYELKTKIKLAKRQRPVTSNTGCSHTTCSANGWTDRFILLVLSHLEPPMVSGQCGAWQPVTCTDTRFLGLVVVIHAV